MPSINDAVWRQAAKADYIQADSDVSDDTTKYFGYLNRDGGWYIMKEVNTSGVYTYRFIRGASDYTGNWTNRASLSYDYFDTIFK